VYDIPANLL